MAAEGAKPRPIAASIGLLFGGLWAYSGASGLPAGLRLPAEAGAGLVTAGFLLALWTRRTPGGSGPGLFRRRGYIIAVGLEIVAIYAATVLLNRHGLTTYLIPVVGVIVGLHFIGLWQATRRSQFLWIAGCMTCVSALSAFLPDAWNGLQPRTVMSGFGNALVLWIGAVWKAGAD